tara:strand:- start:925 stop:1773 length:849 start_codon:yes stop_codon:yes gene_type:complete
MATTKKQVLKQEGKTIPKNRNTFKRKAYNPTAPTMYKMKSRMKGKNGMSLFPIILMLKASDVVYDPETNTNRKIQYIPGESSIFADEQQKDAKAKDSINFNNGFIMVPHTNPTLKRYLDVCNANSSNPHRDTLIDEVFSKVDNQDKAKINLDAIKLINQAVGLALDMPLVQLIGYAKVLRVNTDKTTEEIRWDMKGLAEKNPVDFISGLNDPRTEMKQVILLADEYGVITLGKAHVTWDNGNVICAVPIGVEPEDRLLDFAMEGEGEKVYSEIERRLDQASN